MVVMADAMEHLREALKAKPPLMEAYINLSGLVLKERKLEEALDICEKGLKVADGGEPSLVSQMGTILRHMGRQTEAIERTWKALTHAVLEGQRQSLGEYTSPWVDSLSVPTITHHPTTSPPKMLGGEGKIVVLCVKWGHKYSAAYVNRLAAGIARHASIGDNGVSLSYEMVCVTDDPTDIDKDKVTCIALPPDLPPLQGWWIKAYLFSPALPIHEGEYIQH